MKRLTSLTLICEKQNNNSTTTPIRNARWDILHNRDRWQSESTLRLIEKFEKRN